MQVERGSDTRFWHAFLRLGLGVFILQCGTIWLYLVHSPNGPHRLLLGAIAAVSAALGVLNLFTIRWLSGQPWREGYAVSFTVLASVALTFSIALDDGLSSPLLFMLMLPAMWGGLGFRPRAVGVCVFALITELIVLFVTDGGTDERPGTFLVAMSAALGIGTAVWLTSRQRGRLQQRTDQLTAQLQGQATTDDLTGCLNHRAFFERFNEEIDRAVRYRQPLSLVVADVDRFKHVNDTYGHAEGDAALTMVGAMMRACSRGADVVARIGGDEFAVLLPGTGLQDAAVLAGRMFAPRASGPAGLTFSAGVASLDAAEPTADRLFRDADAALYHSKNTGRSGVATLLPSGVVVRMDGQTDGQRMPSTA